MDRLLVVEIAVPGVERKYRRWDRRYGGPRSAADDLIAGSGSDDDEFVAESGCGAQFRVDIGSDAAAGGRIERAYVDNPHRSRKPRISNELQVKLCSSPREQLAESAAALHMPRMAGQRLLASIHDVAPRFESHVERLLDMLVPYAEDRLALLVVPNHWGGSPIVPRSPFASKLRGWAEAGLEIFVHGFYHRDDRVHERALTRFQARWMTAGEGEFLGLPRDQARKRIERGRDMIESITGHPVAGFVAPAWLYGRGAREALQDCRIAIAESHFRVWSPISGAILSHSPVITWASRTAVRRTSSILAAAALRRLPMRDLRIGVHPGDCGSPQILKSIESSFRIAIQTRQCARYSDLLTI